MVKYFLLVICETFYRSKSQFALVICQYSVPIFGHYPRQAKLTFFSGMPQRGLHFLTTLRILGKSTLDHDSGLKCPCFLEIKSNVLLLSIFSFEVRHILSRPDKEWTGLTGRIRKEILEGSIPRPGEKRKILFCACGPLPFTQEAIRLVKHFYF